VIRSVAFIFAAAGVATASFAQSYPSKPVRLVVPFGPGGGTDLVARIVAAKLTENLAQQVVVDNRAGAAGVIGMEIVAKSPADGHTLVLGSAGPLAINPGLYPKLPYDVPRDFAPISMVTVLPFLLVVHPTLPVKSVRDLVVLANARPGELNYGSPGSGSTTHLATELLKAATGMKITHVPYKGVAAAATDLMSGQVQIMSGDLSTLLPHVKAGKMRGIAVTSAKRSGALPDTPTVAESGVAGYEASGWMGLLGPAGLPPAVIERLHGGMEKALAASETRSRLGALGGDIAGSSPEQFIAYIRSEMAKWGKLIKALGLKPDQS
jgi:tripartite-type tricarboxylate transporter receptor subunit TctC